MGAHLKRLMLEIGMSVKSVTMMITVFSIMLVVLAMAYFVSKRVRGPAVEVTEIPF